MIHGPASAEQANLRVFFMDDKIGHNMVPGYFMVLSDLKIKLVLTFTCMHALYTLASYNNSLKDNVHRDIATLKNPFK